VCGIQQILIYGGTLPYAPIPWAQPARRENMKMPLDDAVESANSMVVSSIENCAAHFLIPCVSVYLLFGF